MESIRDRATHVRARGEAYREASEAMKAVEDEQRLVDAQLGEASGGGGGGDAAADGEGRPQSASFVKRKRSASVLGRVKSLAVRASGVLGDAGEKTSKPTLAAAGNAEARETALKAAFNVFDSDGSGALSHDEIKAIFMRPGGGNPCTDAEVRDRLP